MKTFQQWLEGWRDWPPEEMGDTGDMRDQQEKDWAELQSLVNDYNRNTGQNMSVSHAGTEYEDPRDSDFFTLYIGGEEITQGSLPELLKRVKQIRKEEGF